MTNPAAIAADREAEVLRAQVRMEIERRMRAESDLELWREAKEKADIGEDRAKAELDAERAARIAAEAEVKRLREVLKEGRRAIGDHYAPNDCYATGPLTGDTFRDLIQCPACSFLAMYDALTPASTPVDERPS